MLGRRIRGFERTADQEENVRIRHEPQDKDAAPVSVDVHPLPVHAGQRGEPAVHRPHGTKQGDVSQRGDVGGDGERNDAQPSKQRATGDIRADHEPGQWQSQHHGPHRGQRRERQGFSGERHDGGYGDGL